MTTVIVVDASIIAVALADDGPDGDNTRSVLSTTTMFRPSMAVGQIVIGLGARPRG